MSFLEDCDLVAVVPKLNVVADIKLVCALFCRGIVGTIQVDCQKDPATLIRHVSPVWL